jgi:hypothetical protein
MNTLDRRSCETRCVTRALERYNPFRRMTHVRFRPETNPLFVRLIIDLDELEKEDSTKFAWEKEENLGYNLALIPTECKIDSFLIMRRLSAN